MDTLGSTETVERPASDVDETWVSHGEPSPFAPTPELERLEPGTTVSHYVILDHVGEGGMGAVYSAFDPRLDRRVAIKLLHPSRHRANPQAAQHRLMREAQALAKLGHPNVVAVHDVGHHEGQVFLAMEFVDGPTLGEWLAPPEQPPPPLTSILAVLIAAGEGLAAAHRAGLIHRDFKPDNVMLDGHGRPRVMDFGLARAEDETETERDADAALEAHVDPHTRSSDALATPLTQTGAVLGTPAYMAPEQHLGLPTDARCDQFAFCVTAFEALYGVRPFEGSTLAQLGLSVTAGELREPPRDRDVPSWIHAVLVRGLSVSAEARFADMDALLEALRDDPSVRRRRTSAIAIGLLTLVGLVGIAAGLIGGREQPTRPCQGTEQTIAEVWSTPHAEAVRAAFAATDRSYAEATATRVIADLDAFTDEWVGIHRGACEATHVRKERSLELLDRQMACLSRARTELRELVEVFEAADGTVVDEAIVAVDHLPRLSTCSDLDQLLSGVSPPGPGLDARVDAAREGLAVARARRTTGDPSAALELLAEQADEVAAIGYGPLAAEFALESAHAHHEAGDFREAASGFERGYALAVEHHYDELAAAASAELIYVVGYRLAEHRAGQAWIVSARAWADRVDPGGPGYALVLHNTGVLWDALGDEQRAEPAYREALAIRRRVYGDHHPLVARSIHNLGNIELDAGRFEQAAEHYAQARDLNTAIFGADHPAVSGALNNLGLTYRNMRRFEASAVELRRAVAIMERTWGRDHPDVAQTLNNLATSAIGMGALDEAERHAERSLAIRLDTIGPEHPDVADTRMTLAEIALLRGNTDDALREASEAVESYAANFAPGHPLIGEALVIRGRVELEIGALDEAVADLERAATIHRDHDMPAHMRAACLGALALAYAARGDADRAAATRDESLEFYAAAGSAWDPVADELRTQFE